MSVVIETTLGDLTVDLFLDERPIACLNFLKLCKLKYYNFNLFHTVEQGFIAQTGDPTGTGDGGSSVWGVLEGMPKRFFEAENLPKIRHTSPGLLSMVSVGKNMVGSQFFFTLATDLTSLDGIHCVIGEVVEGHETLRKLNNAIVDESFRPYQDIRITHTVVLDDPLPDPRAFIVPSRSPSPTPMRLQGGRIGADEDIDDTDGKTMAEIQEMLEAREAKARATILEIVGDLPDAEMAPPENVLFVCKLNPVTSEDDLDIIFSRFGKVKSCEVIRDKKTGDSLQYAFIEFEERKSCEMAYFKMDNVLIDDRRIHVDFSQSVAKVTWRGKGRGVEGQQGKLDFNNLAEKHVARRQDRRQQRSQSQDERRNANEERLELEERRKLREERHREQNKQDRAMKQRSRSRSRYYNNRRRLTSRENEYAEEIENRRNETRQPRDNDRSRYERHRINSNDDYKYHNRDKSNQYIERSDARKRREELKERGEREEQRKRQEHTQQDEFRERDERGIREAAKERDNGRSRNERQHMAERIRNRSRDKQNRKKRVDKIKDKKRKKSDHSKKKSKKANKKKTKKSKRSKSSSSDSTSDSSSCESSAKSSSTDSSQSDADEYKPQKRKNDKNRKSNRKDRS